MRIPKAHDFVEAELRKCNAKISAHFTSDTLIIKAPIRPGLDNIIRFEIESLRLGRTKNPGTLSVILETMGGYIEVAERIYNVFRHHYQTVNFIVPNYAFSAGTVLALSGDDLYMDYYSFLGPIDPQMENGNERFVSGLGYLAKYNELRKLINNAKDPDTVRAEIEYLVNNFDPAELFEIEQARRHSEELLETWLTKHKFKTWTETETRKLTVSDEFRRDRAKQIAGILSDPERWHSHGRGISLNDLKNEDIKLKVIDFGDDKDLNRLIRSYYELFIDFCRKIGVNSVSDTVLHSALGVRRV